MRRVVARRVPVLALVLTVVGLPAAAGPPPRPVGPEIPLAWSVTGVALQPHGDGVAVGLRPTLLGDQVWLQRVSGETDAPLADPAFLGLVAAPDFLASRPVVGADAAGNFVVAWTGPRGPDRLPTVYARRFDAAGRPRASAFPVSAASAERAFHPVLSVAPGGRFAVAWGVLATNGYDFSVVARAYLADGTPSSPRFQVNAHGFGGVNRDKTPGGIVLSPDGTLAVVWEAFEGEGSFEDVFFRRFRADGTPLTGDVAVHDNTQWVHQHSPALARLAGGGYLIAYASDYREDDTSAVVGVAVAADGTPAPGDQVLNDRAAGDQVDPVVAALPDGGFVALWTDRCALYSSGPTPPDCSLPENGRDGSFDGVFGRAFSADLVPAGDALRVNADPVGPQHSPSLAVAADGEMVAGYDSQSLGRARRLVPPCAPDARTLCLAGEDRFAARVDWRDFQGNRGDGVAGADGGDGWGTFWFFTPGNTELVVKVLDGRSINLHHWLFYASLSNVEYTLEVLDTLSGIRRLYHNPARHFASRGDTAAFGPDVPVNAAAPAAAGRAVAPAGPSTCPGPPATLCLADNRFAVEIDWQDPLGGAGPGRAVALTGDSGFFWFFGPDNPEVVVKVLDGRAVNGHYWVFYGSLTNVEFHLVVTDTTTGQPVGYSNPAGTFASRGDTSAFPGGG